MVRDNEVAPKLHARLLAQGRGFGSGNLAEIGRRFLVQYGKLYTIMQLLGIKKLPVGDTQEAMDAELRLVFKMMKTHGIRAKALAEVFGRPTTLGELADLEAFASPGE